MRDQSDEQPDQRPDPQSDQRRLSAAQRKIILRASAGFALTIILAAAVVIRLTPARPRPALSETPALPEPVSYEQIAHEIKAREDHALNRYRWQNSEKTTAQIPIERAIEILKDHPEELR